MVAVTAIFFFLRLLMFLRMQPESKNLHFPEYAPHGGAFPIWIKNVPSAPIGVIIVSGLPQEDDHKSTS